MKVVLAEKPSVAREIAAFLGAQSRRDGYLEGNGYQVTWTFGHLVTLKEPDEYDPALKKWSLERLPFIPERFELKLVPEKHARQQFAVVKQLFHAATEIICATDAGREGELIFRYVLTMTGCKGKPVRRLWLSSLTRRAIDDAFRQLKPGGDYDRLYAAAKCRGEADWIVGLNGTRNYTVRFGADGILWSVGRVQTPVLALIVQRDDEIRTFRPEPFWELLTRYRETLFRFAGDRFQAQAAAQAMLDRVLGQLLTVTKIDRQRERSQPPQLYDLTELQRDLNRRYGLSAADTLAAAQALYERKLITYPRTDSRYLGSDMKREIPEIFRSLQAIRQADIDRLDLSSLRFTGRIIDDRKVSDHHAMIPTGSLPGPLAGAEQKVFDAVVTRLIAAFYPACEKEVTTVHAVSNEVPFRAKGYRVIEPGWTALYPRGKHDQENGEEDQSQALPPFTPGERGPHEPSLKRGETTPPKPYTENTLLGAMETAGKLVNDEQLREVLKEKGLGTPATRAAIIETLLKRKYIERRKKTLAATDLGRYLIAVVEDPELKSPELTGQWEGKLRQIESGRLDPQRFMAEIAEYTRRIVSRAGGAAVDQSHFGDCPRCGKPVIQGNRGFGCSGWRDGCPFVLWPEYKDQTLTAADIRQLLQQRVLMQPMRVEGHEVILTLTAAGQVAEIPVPSKSQQLPGRRQRSAQKSFRGRSKSGRGRARTEPAAGAGAEPDSAAPAVLGSCPLCAAEVRERPKSYSCSNGQCRFVIWKTIAGKRITARTAKTLLDRGETPLLEGFQSKAGKAFSARLKVLDGQVKFVFDRE
ncbi:MAG: DNA topoisomerase 3 [Candidatus Anammoximicrobium sp.]|nr:DNA topoisomerase 3 [Candidatus Anammoximicrobium sp.]